MVALNSIFFCSYGLSNIGLMGARYYVRNLIGKYVKGCDAWRRRLHASYSMLEKIEFVWCMMILYFETYLLEGVECGFRTIHKLRSDGMSLNISSMVMSAIFVSTSQ